MPDDLSDDQLEHISTEIAAQALARHPASSPAERERYVRLYLRQLAGEVSPPGQITNKELSAHLALDPRRISEHYLRALSRLRADPQARKLAKAYLDHLSTI